MFIIHEDVQEEEKNHDEYKILKESLVFTPYENICKCCEKYLNYSQNQRDDICEKTFDIYKKHFDMNERINEIIPYI